MMATPTHNDKTKEGTPMAQTERAARSRNASQQKLYKDIMPALRQVDGLLREARYQLEHGTTRRTQEPATLLSLYATLEALQHAAFDAKNIASQHGEAL